MDEITEERLRRVIIDTNSPVLAELTLDATFDELGFDELDSIELVVAVEKEFDIEVPDEDFEKWTCMRNVLEYVEEKLRVRELRSMAKGPSMPFSEAARLDAEDRKRRGA